MGPVDISLVQLLSAYVFVVILMLILKARKIPREKDVLIASLRMTLQLVLAGFILSYILENPTPFYTILAVIVMEAFAIYNVYRRAKLSLPKNVKMRLEFFIAISVSSGTLLSLFYFLYVVVRISPWFDPRYVVPLAGMIIGNSMTGVSLGVKSLSESILSQKPLVEAALMLGARPKDATKYFSDKAFDSAILPTINSMIGMGIVFLPGMMTGQILSGTSPITAIKYQIAIMLGILGGVTISVSVFLMLGYRAFFNKEDQLII
ncbi:MAG: UDP-glucose/iron transport system permease protein [Thermotoga sp.]|nr:UDP-glucose/iron transport system permease protein [Thermotoga sp.]